MIVTLFHSATDIWPGPMSLSWEEWAKELKTQGHTILELTPELETQNPQAWKEAKLGCPMFSPAEFTPEGTRREKDVVCIHFGVLDLDHLTQDQLAEFILLVQERGTEALLYTAFSHHSENVSVRAMFPFSRAVPADFWAAFWPRFNAYFGGYGDPQCKSVERAYFLPSCPRFRLPEAEIIHYPGGLLDVDRILDMPSSRIPATAHVIQSPPRSTVKVSREELDLLAKKLAKKSPETGLALRRVLQGEPWAEPGHRDNLLFKVSGELAKAFPQADAASIALHFQASVSHFPDFTLDMVQDKIQRRQAEALEAQEAAEREAIQQARQAIRDAFTGGAWEGRDAPYTILDVESFARENRCSQEDFRKRWILQLGVSYYFWVGGRGYVGPYGKDESKLAAHSFLAPATSVGVRLTEISLTGEFVRRPIQDLVLDHGTVADSAVLDMTAQSSYFDLSTRTIHRAPCPVRKLEPAFHPQVHGWLQMLAGEEYHNLETWLSWITDLSRPSVALFLEGVPGSGKSLLAKGLARIWTKNQPTSLEQALGAFNDSLADCPLVFADEILPKDFRGRGRTGELREFIQSDQRPYKRKYLPDATLKGCARVVIAANNRGILEGEENLTANDVSAIVGRFLHIEAPREAADLLRLVDTTGWVAGDLIAKHVLWIVQNVPKPSRTPRFLVESPKGKLARTMATSTIMGSAVAHWIVAFLLDPDRLRGGRPAGDSAFLIRVHNGRVHAHPRVFSDHWERYSTNVPKEKATARNVMTGLHGLSDTLPHQRISLGVPGYSHRNRPKFYAVRTEDLIEWAQGGYSSAEEILLALANLEEIDRKALDP